MAALALKVLALWQLIWWKAGQRLRVRKWNSVKMATLRCGERIFSKKWAKIK
jgi:hypothetical protein